MTHAPVITITPLETRHTEPEDAVLAAMRITDEINDQYYFDEVLEDDDHALNDQDIFYRIALILDLLRGADLPRAAFTGADGTRICVSAQLDTADATLPELTLCASTPGGATISTVVTGLSTLLARGGYTLTDAYESIELAHLLHGAAGTLSDAATTTVAALTEPGTEPGTVLTTALSLIDVCGDAEMIRYEARCSLATQPSTLQALDTLDDQALLSALRKVIASPAGMRVQRTLDAAAGEKTQCLLSEELAPQLAWLSTTAAAVATGKQVDLL